VFVPAIKARIGSKVMAPLIFKFGTSWPLYLKGKKIVYESNRNLGGPHDRSG